MDSDHVCFRSHILRSRLRKTSHMSRAVSLYSMKGKLNVSNHVHGDCAFRRFDHTRAESSGSPASQATRKTAGSNSFTSANLTFFCSVPALFGQFERSFDSSSNSLCTAARGSGHMTLMAPERRMRQQSYFGTCVCYLLRMLRRCA